jgi:hypothetical protein
MEEVLALVALLFLGGSSSSSSSSSTPTDTPPTDTPPTGTTPERPCYKVETTQQPAMYGGRWTWVVTNRDVAVDRHIAVLAEPTKALAIAAAQTYVRGTLGGTLCGSKLPPATTLQESNAHIRVDVDGKSVAILRVGTTWRMYVDHVLDPRKFADLAGVLQRTILVTAPSKASRISIDAPKGTATLLRGATSYSWSVVRTNDVEHAQSGIEPTMMDALGAAYQAAGTDFFS